MGQASNVSFSQNDSCFVTSVVLAGSVIQSINNNISFHIAQDLCGSCINEFPGISSTAAFDRKHEFLQV